MKTNILCSCGIQNNHFQSHSLNVDLAQEMRIIQPDVKFKAINSPSSEVFYGVQRAKLS